LTVVLVLLLLLGDINQPRKPVPVLRGVDPESTFPEFALSGITESWSVVVVVDFFCFVEFVVDLAGLPRLRG
jgi:hypothetical protein